MAQSLLVMLASEGGHVGETDEVDRLLDDPREISMWLDGFWSALHEATDSEFRDGGALEESIHNLTRMRARLNEMDVIRPFVRGVTAAQAMADSCVGMVQHYLGALLASTPIEAQREGDRAQRELDRLADQARELDHWLGRQETLSSSKTVQETLGMLIADCFQESGTESLLQLAQSFKAQLAEDVGAEPELDAAISYGLNAAFADVFLSREDFVSKVRHGVQLLRSPHEHLAAMLRDPVFQADAQRLRLEVFDSGVACQSAIERAAHPRQAARAVVELHATLVESGGMVIALAYLTAAGQKNAPYASLRRGDATEHLRKAQSNPVIADLLAGLDGHLRTAHAHRGISFGDEHLLTDIRSGQRKYGYGEVIDATFEAVESALAGLLSIQIVSSERGWAAPDASDLEVLGFSPRDVATFLLTSFGFPCHSVGLRDGVLEVELEGSVLGFTVAVGALLPSMQVDDFNAIRVTTDDGSSWACPREPYDEFRHADDEFEKQLALIWVQRSWRSENDTPWMSDAALQKWTATQITETLNLEARERFQRLALLRGLARRLGSEEIDSFVRKHVRLARLQLDGQAAGESERAALQLAIAWATSSVSFDLI